MKSTTILLYLAASISTLQAQDTKSLAATFKGKFHIGAAIGKGELTDTTPLALSIVQKEFNSITSTNLLKWSVFNPQPNKHNTAISDAYIKFGKKHQLHTVGHVLFWHNQTPKWVFKENKKTVSRATLLKRMRTRIKHLTKLYGPNIHAWDVVNEAVIQDGTLRKSPWLEILGDQWVDEAFKIAQQELPKSTQLIYNDFSMCSSKKRQAVVKLVKGLQAKDIKIDAVGMQGHWSLTHPSLEEIEKSIIAFAATGVKVHITELDIDVLPREKDMYGADINKRFAPSSTNNPYPKNLPDAVQQKLAQRYSDIFKLFLKHHEKIERVTFWGVTDADSWLNNWPIKGRTNHPLLFDRKGLKKPAYHSVLKSTQR